LQVAQALGNLGYSERTACRVVGLNRSTFYSNKHHVPSDGEIRQLLLSDVIAQVHAQSRQTCGKRRVRAALAIEHGLIVNAKLVSKLMRQLQIQGLPRHKKSTRNLANIATHDDLVERNFVADRPNALWLTDITEHPTREAKVYCCCVLDIYSRKVVGWAIDRRCETALVNDALSMAAQTRAITSSTVIHSDHGSQFTSWGFSENIRRYGLLGSMGTVGDCYDNSPMESFWGTMQIELLNRKRWTTVVELSVAMAEFIENFYNPSRRHSSLNYLTPNEFENLQLPITQITLA